MARAVPQFGLIVLLFLAGCGGTSNTSSIMQPPSSARKARVSTCGAHAGFGFKLHKVNCEIANILIAMLDGRALHQSVTLTAEGKRRGRWICTSPTHSPVDRLHCRQGARFFTAERTTR